jgi:hypothetical protein
MRSERSQPMTSRRMAPLWSGLLVACGLLLAAGPLQAQTTLFSDGFGTDMGWVTNPLGTDTATTGQWQRGNPEGTTSSGLALQLDPCAGGTPNCLATGLAAGASAGANDVDGGITRIQSPTITLPASATVTLTFNFYFAHLSNSSADDFFRARVVRADGTTMVVFQELGTAANDAAAFTARTVDLSSFAGQTIRLRFEAADNAGGSLVEAAVDDVRVVSSAAGTPIVQVFQHCDFGGWVANFTAAGSFNTADLVSRGGVDNDASSVKVASGFKATLFDGNNQSGASVVLRAGDTACLVDQGFNDVLSSLRIEPDTAGGGCGSTDIPATLTDPIGGHGLTMTCLDANDQVALYGDNDFRNLGSGRTGWVLPFATDVWRFLRDNYGTCARQPPPPLLPPIAPGCERFGTIPLRMMFHQNRFFGGTLANRFDSFTGFRNVIDVGDNGWNESNAILHDEIVHEMCHHVEGDSQGIHESPAFGVIWGDSKWVEFCMYDFYVRSGRTAFADRVFADFMDNRDNLPQGSTGSAWFRDWFFPLWDQNGRTARVMERFFELLAQHFPKHLENSDRNLIYDRRMNPGEFVHFTSAAAGRDLSRRAADAFNGFDRNQFLQARQTFSALNSLYTLEP